MGLQEQMLADLDNVFLNLDEFACEHIFQGKKLVCIVDDANAMSQSSAAGDFRNPGSIGVLQCDRMVWCKACDLAPVPLAGSRVEMDGKLWIVGDEITEIYGMVTLPLNRTY